METKRKPGRPKTPVAERKLTGRQKAYVDAKLTGASDGAAATLVDGNTHHMQDLRDTETIRHQIAAARSWLTDVTQITRLNVIEGIIDGIEMARHLGDAAAVIKGWVEVSKLLGYAQVEKPTVNLTINQMQFRNKLESMPDNILLAISEGRTIDGQFTEVSGSTSTSAKAV